MSRQPRPTALLILSTLLLALAAPAQAQRSFTEDFSTTTHRDAANTTVEWDTVAKRLYLPPFTPVLIGSSTTPVDAWEVEIVGDLAFIADGGSGLRILDITDPTNPVQLGAIDTPVSVHDLCVDGDLVYLADGPTGMLIVDVSDPTTPTLLGTYNSPGAVRDIVISGKHAIVADDSAGIRVVDVSNPATPVEVGFVNPPGIARGLDISGNQVYVANGFQSFLVVDITDPTNPLLLGSCTTLDNAVDVVVDGDYAYVADGAMGASIIDISIPGLPILGRTQNTGDYVRGVDVEGNNLYVSDGLAGLKIYNISDPEYLSLRYTMDTPGNAYGVDVDGTLAYVADLSGGLQVIRVAYQVGTGLISSRSLPDIADGIAVSGNHLVVAAGLSGVRVMDITDEILPTERGFIDLPGNTRDVAIEGNHVYVANGFQDFRVIDISVPSSPIEVGSTVTLGAAQGVAVSGDYAYVADGSFGLRVLDVSDPTNPVFAGMVDTPDHARGIAIAGDHAYLADGPGGLRVIDISNPITPLLVGWLDTPGDAANVAVAGDHVYLADETGGLRIVDVRDPTLPLEVAFRSAPPGVANDVAVSGNYVYIAGTGLSVTSFDISDPSNPLGATANGVGGTGHALALAGHHAYVTMDTAEVQTREIYQYYVDSTANLANSTDVAPLDEGILKLRLTTTQGGAVSWRVSTTGGVGTEPITPGGDWITPMFGIDSDLRWRATLTYSRLGQWVAGLTLEWLIDAPVVNSVEDIPNDQGRQVRVEWARSGHDFLGDAQQITEYAVYRQIEAGLKRSAHSADTRMKPGDWEPAREPLTGESIALQEHATLMAQAGWDFITTVPVRVEDYYAFVAPTLADSSIVGGLQLSTFMVSALTATPGVFFDSDPVDGYSVDNLAPGVPKNITAAYGATGTQLDWDDALEEDFQLFRVYRATQPGFTPSTQNLIQEVAGSQWSDSSSNPWGFYYQISAVDHAGNEGPVGAPGIVTDAPIGTRPTTYALQEAMPNPFNPSTVLRFTVPGGEATRVRLEIFDSVGRLVARLVNEPRDPGEYSVRWQGTDTAGRRVVSGVYFARLEVEGYPYLTRKMALVK